MHRIRTAALAVAILAAALLGAGCPLGGLTNNLTVEVVNDTDFDVQPNIAFDEDDGFFGSLFPADTLDTGLIAPGDSARFRFDCDAVGTILSTGAEQVGVLFTATADSSSALQRDEDYTCGDVIRFRFVGNGSDFGVIVEVNGRIVD